MTPITNDTARNTKIEIDGFTFEYVGPDFWFGAADDCESGVTGTPDTGWQVCDADTALVADFARIFDAISGAIEAARNA